MTCFPDKGLPVEGVRWLKVNPSQNGTSMNETLRAPFQIYVRLSLKNGSILMYYIKMIQFNKHSKTCLYRVLKNGEFHDTKIPTEDWIYVLAYITRWISNSP